VIGSEDGFDFTFIMGRETDAHSFSSQECPLATLDRCYRAIQPRGDPQKRQEHRFFHTADADPPERWTGEEADTTAIHGHRHGRNESMRIAIAEETRSNGQCSRTANWKSPELNSVLQ